MRLTRARARNFKIFKDSGWVNIEENISVLVGENESGKTSFLEAIDFFQNNEKYSSAEKYLCNDTDKNQEKIPIITLEFEVEPSDQIKFGEVDARFKDIEKLRVTRYWDGKKEIQNKKIRKNISRPSEYKESYQKFEEVRRRALESIVRYEEIKEYYREHFSRDLNENYQSVSIRELQSVIKDLLKDIKAAPTPNENARSMEFRIQRDLEEIFGELPDREDEVQGDILKFTPEILFYRQEDKLPDQISLEKMDTDSKSTFQNLLKLGGMEKIESYTDKEIQEQFRIQTIIQDDIKLNLNRYWEQKEVELEIKNDGSNLAVFIRDMKKDGEKVARDPELPSQRSRGFNWFLSFYINFKAVSKSRKDTILLLDDPAAYLYPKGKQNWVEAMEGISQDNQVLYTSHSPYSIDKRHPNRVRLVKDKGTKKSRITSNPTEAGELTLEPLRSALGIALGD